MFRKRKQKPVDDYQDLSKAVEEYMKVLKQWNVGLKKIVNLMNPKNKIL